MRDADILHQQLAASSLIVFCEKIAGSGNLPEPDEITLRELIVKVCRAYDMPTVAERPARSLVR